jgi:SAM-dependent methyltransferase
LFDLRYGIDTSRIEPLWSLSIDSKIVRFGFRYEVTGEDEFTEALAMIPGPLEQFTFIDLGCGKGRTLVMAAQMRFAEVIGVEFARELVETARRNFEILGLSGTIIQQDAADFEFPARNIVVYMYNPFSEEVMMKVLHNIRATRSGVTYIIYKVPLCADMLDKSEWLTSIGSPRGRNYIRLWKSSE